MAQIRIDVGYAEKEWNSMSEYKNPSHEEMNAQQGSSQTASGSTSQGQGYTGNNQDYSSGTTGQSLVAKVPAARS